MRKLPLPETRREFFVLRSGLSAVMLALFIGLVRLIWYPGLHFHLAGMPRLILILAAVVLIIGPGLSTLVYRPEKRQLLVDLGTILVVELVAIGLAASVLYERRPYYAVFAVDRFEIIATNEVSGDQFQYEELRRKPGHAPRLIFATYPEDRAKLMEDILLHGAADIDIQPLYWHPYATGIRDIFSRTKPLADLAANDADMRKILRWTARHSGNVDDYVFLPVQGRANDGAMVLHRRIGYPIGMLGIDPWQGG